LLLLVKYDIDNDDMGQSAQYENKKKRGAEEHGGTPYCNFSQTVAWLA